MTVDAENHGREARLRAIRRLVTLEELANQDALAERLRTMGFSATQSSVSRDIRELGVFKQKGRYRLPEAEPLPGPVDSDLAEFATYVTAIAGAGPNLLVIKTRTGAATRCALALDRSQFPEIVGTIAGDDTIFCALADRNDQRRLLTRLKRALIEVVR